MEIKVKNVLHTTRMNEIIEDDEHNKFNEDDFYELLKSLKSKKKDKYKFLLQSGRSFQSAIFRLF